MDELSAEEKAKAEAEAKWDKWYWTQVEQVKGDIDSGTDSFDKSMLTLSSAALGVSLAFIKDIVPLGQAAWISLLLVSWIAFALCIVTTVVSFLFSIRALKKHRDLLDEMLEKKDKGLESKPASRVNLVAACTYVALVLFLVGLTCTVIFVVVNVSNAHVGQSARPPDAATVSNVRNFYMGNDENVGKVTRPQDLTRGRQPMKVVPAPAPAAPAAPPAPCPAKE